MSNPSASSVAERLKRWRLILGDEAAASIGVELRGDDLAIDAALTQLYDGMGRSADGKPRRVGMGKSAPKVARWLGDIRKYFPGPVVQLLQKEAMERLDLRSLLK